MTRSPRRVPPLLALCAGTSLVLVTGCATARPERPVARLVAPSAWNDVVDCVMLSARTNDFYAELDSAGILITAGVTPFTPFRPATRTSVIGRVRVSRTESVNGLLVTTDASGWDARGVRPDSSRTSSATRVVEQQLDRQCLSGYQKVALK